MGDLNFMKRSLFLSHRGESDSAPENTVFAFALAMDRDSDGIELDVRLTSDKQVVCVHDSDLLRVAGSPAVVAESTLAELQKIWNVPLLSEALTVLNKTAHMQIELKGSPELIPYCRDVINAFPEKHRQLAISSFESETIAAAADFFPDFPRLLLIDLEEKFGYFPTAGEVIEMLKTLRCSISFKADFRATSEFVAALKADGLRVVCWGVSSDELGLDMAKKGVDAMTSNHAYALRKLFWANGIAD